MFKTGELVKSRRGSGIGMIIEVKSRYTFQYCKVLWTGEPSAFWVAAQELAEYVENS